MATALTKNTRARKTTRSKPEPPTVAGRPSEDEIRQVAYRLYEMRSAAGIPGDADSDWIEAERLLISDGELAAEIED